MNFGDAALLYKHVDAIVASDDDDDDDDHDDDSQYYASVINPE